MSLAPASAAPGALRAEGTWASIFDEGASAALDARLPAYVAARRWFRGKSRQIARATVADVIPLEARDEPHPRLEPGATPAVIAIVHVAYADGGVGDDYALPLSFVTGDEADDLRARRPHLVVAELHVQCAHASYDGVLCDAVGDTRALRALLGHVERADTLEGKDACLRFRRLEGSEDQADGGRSASGNAEPRVIDAEQTNTSIVYGDAYILKVVRRLDDGASPDLEMGEVLTAAGYTHAPAVAGAAELVREGREPATLAILHRFVANRGDAWSYMLDVIGRHLAGARTGTVTGTDDAAVAGGRVGLLAERVASLHLALASRVDAPLFAPEPLAQSERAALADAVRASLRRAFAALASRLAATPPSLPADAVAVVTALVPREAELGERLRRFVDGEPGAGARALAQKTRVHGDLHLGQVLFTGEDFVIIDFEGEPARPLAERKAKRSPLADVAGMLRSLHYASISAARAFQPSSPAIDRAAAAWHDAARDAFLEAYLARVREGCTTARFLPDDPAALRAMLDFYLLEKCVSEVHYEIDNRPDWVAIPAAGLAQLLEEPDAR